MLAQLFALLVVLAPFVSSAQTAPEKFASGVQAYRAKDYGKAKAEFQEALHLEPNAASTLYNLALTESKLGEKGLALAYLRKALNMQPSYHEAAKALSLMEATIDRPFASREISNWEVLRSTLLQPISTQTYIGLALVFTLLTGWLLLGYWGRRQNALREEQPLPGFPVVGCIMASLLIISLALCAAKGVDYLAPRATVLKSKTPIKSGPSDESTTLFELNPGNEVIVRTATNNWAQVTYPGGMTGWVQQDNIMHTSGRVPW